MARHAPPHERLIKRLDGHDAEHSTDSALRALARLLGRQTAREALASENDQSRDGDAE